MSALILLTATLMSFSAFATPECDTLAVECQNQICQNRTSSANTDFMAEFEQNGASTPLPENVSQQLAQVNTALTEFQTKTQPLFTATPQQVVEGFYKDFSSQLADMKVLVSHRLIVFRIPLLGRFAILNSQEQGNTHSLKRFAKHLDKIQERQQARQKMVSANDPQRLKKTLKEVERFYQDTGNTAKARHYKEMRESLKLLPAPQVLARFGREFSPADWNKLLNYEMQPVKADLLNIMPELQTSLRNSITQRIKDTAPDGMITRSCRFHTFMMNKYAQINPEETYKNQVSRAIQGMRTRFYPKISDSTRHVLDANLNKVTQKTADGVKITQVGENAVFTPFKHSPGVYPDFVAMKDKLSASLPEVASAGMIQSQQALNTIQGCDINEYMPTDHYRVGEKIYSSKFSLIVDNDILPHELGHWTSHQLRSKDSSKDSSKKYSEMRKCLRGFYKRNFWQKIGLGQGRVEEDFADWFAATTSDSDLKFSCDIYGFMAKGVAYVTGKPLPEKNNYTPEKGDSHSNSLFRDVHRSMVRGEELPASCKQLVNLEPSVTPKKCEF